MLTFFSKHPVYEHQIRTVESRNGDDEFSFYNICLQLVMSYVKQLLSLVSF